MKQDVLDLVCEYIESIEYNFPRTHDDEVKINILTDLYADVKNFYENFITENKIQKALQCLIDNGIDEDEACVVLQALGYILLDEELFPEVI